MTELAYPLPEIGEASIAADPRTLEALINIKAWAAGQIDSSNLKTSSVEGASLKGETITGSKIAPATIKSSNIEPGVFGSIALAKAIINGQESTNSTSYDFLTTPDRVEVTMPENGLFAILYNASWSESIAGVAQAELVSKHNLFPYLALSYRNYESESLGSAEVAGPNHANIWQPLSSYPGGLRSGGGGVNTPDAADIVGFLPNAISGFCLMRGSSGSYKIGVRFKVSSGEVKVKLRSLWVATLA